MKHCNRCNRDLPENKFGKNGNGSRSICKDCQCERIKQGQRETRLLIDQEVMKCDILCANCHREEHAKRNS